MLDCQLFGLKPGAHHFVNVLLHSVSAVLLFLLLEQMSGSPSSTRDEYVRLADRTGRIWPSAFVAAVFAIHPLHVESVAWVAERKDVLSGLFFMLTVMAYFRYIRKETVGRYVMMSILFACGLMSKPMLVTLPIVLLLLDYWPLQRMRRTENRGQRTVGSLIIEKIPLCLLSIASAVATLIAQSKAGLVPIKELPMAWRITNDLSAYFIYIWQMLWPANLALAYSHPGKLPIWQTASAAALLVAITLYVLFLRRRSPYLVVGWFWYMIILLPVIGLVQVGGQAHADRYTYLPQIGLSIAMAWGIADLSVSWPHQREILGGAAAMVTCALVWCAAKQVWYWHDSERLWRHALAVTSQNDVAHLGLGGFLVDEKHLDEAVTELRTVVTNHPNDRDARLKLASALAEKDGRTNEAIAEFEAAAKIGEPNPDIETNLANLLLQQGRIEEAIRYYREVVQLQPSSALAHYNLAIGLHRLGRLSEEIVHYKEALAVDPGYPDAEFFLGQALLQNGQADEAKPHLEKR